MSPPLFVDGVDIEQVFVDGVEQDELYVDDIRVFQARDPAGSQIFEASGQFTVPRGYDEVVICICGGGGAGGGDFGNLGGGGGGSGVLKYRIPVTEFEVIQVDIGGRQPYSPASTPAPSSFFRAASGVIEAGGGFSATNANAPGSGVNGGGNGSWAQNPVSLPGDPCPAEFTCDGVERPGGVNGPITNPGNGGASGFSQGGSSREFVPLDAFGAGCGGGNTNQNLEQREGGQGLCIVYWGDTEPPSPAPIFPPEAIEYILTSVNIDGTFIGFRGDTGHGTLVPDEVNGIDIVRFQTNININSVVFIVTPPDIPGVTNILLSFDDGPSVIVNRGGLPDGLYSNTSGEVSAFMQSNIGVPLSLRISPL